MKAALGLIRELGKHLRSACAHFSARKSKRPATTLNRSCPVLTCSYTRRSDACKASLDRSDATREFLFLAQLFIGGRPWASSTRPRGSVSASALYMPSTTWILTSYR